jgi:hypothetical protein
MSPMWGGFFVGGSVEINANVIFSKACRRNLAFSMAAEISLDHRVVRLEKLAMTLPLRSITYL